MASTARPDIPRTAADGRIFALGLWGILAITLWRVALLPFDHADLYVDDAQYWFWCQTLDFGYYSKPPLIAWILRLSTTLGTDSPFFIRLPLPLIHAATAVILAFAARRLYGARVGAITGFTFAGAPAVAVASLLVSTDTPMLCCFALALLAWIHLAERASTGWAIVLGAAIGTGLMAKYAMIYFPISAIIAALALPAWRIARRDALIAAAVALLFVSPNLVWNATNGFTTLHHTADNTQLEKGASLDVFELLSFWANQFVITGPVFFAAYLAGLGSVRRDSRAAFLALMSLPTLAIVSVQALLAGAHGNWAAAGHIAGLVLACAVLAPRPRLLAIGLAINLAVTAALPVASIFAQTWKVGDNLVFAGYAGQEAFALRAAETARGAGLDTLVAENRGMLAAMFYSLRDAGLSLYAEPTQGFPPHHYAQKHPLPPGEGDVLFLTHTATGPACRTPGTPVEIVGRWTPEVGFTTREILAFRVPRSCWFPPAP